MVSHVLSQWHFDHQINSVSKPGGQVVMLLLLFLCLTLFSKLFNRLSGNSCLCVGLLWSKALFMYTNLDMYILWLFEDKHKSYTQLHTLKLESDITQDLNTQA